MVRYKDSPYAVALRARLRKGMRYQELTMTIVAQRMGISIQYVSKILRGGEYGLSPHMLNRILDAMQVTDATERSNFHVLAAKAHGWEITEEQQHERERQASGRQSLPEGEGPALGPDR